MNYKAIKGLALGSLLFSMADIGLKPADTINYRCGNKEYKIKVVRGETGPLFEVKNKGDRYITKSLTAACPSGKKSK